MRKTNNSKSFQNSENSKNVKENKLFCDCFPPFQGNFCEIVPFCLNGGEKIENSSNCKCPENFEGAACEIPKCSYGERLYDEEGYYYCRCLPDTDGETCQNDLTCYHGGTLINGTCHCVSPFSGRLCIQTNTTEIL
mgnify:CR=1 FL=1